LNTIKRHWINAKWSAHYLITNSNNIKTFKFCNLLFQNNKWMCQYWAL
jgi:hypothetical protein